MPMSPSKVVGAGDLEVELSSFHMRSNMNSMSSALKSRGFEELVGGVPLHALRRSRRCSLHRRPGPTFRGHGTTLVPPPRIRYAVVNGLVRIERRAGGVHAGVEVLGATLRRTPGFCGKTGAMDDSASARNTTRIV
jgi:hypothetical protein